MSENATSKTPKTLTEKFMALFNIGDEGKVQSFFDRQRKRLVRSVEANKRLMENEIKFNYPGRLEVLTDELSDAKGAEEGSYLTLDVEKIGTKAEQDSYAIKYWENVDKLGAVVDAIEEQISKAKADHETVVDDLKDQITNAEARIAKIDG
jgi:hypothetical protein